jgi:hypothetical protein
MVGKCDAFAGDADFRKIIRPGIKPEAMDAAERMAFGNLLDEAHVGDDVGIEQLKEAQPVWPRGVEAGAIGQGGVIAQDFMKAIGAFIHAGDAVGQPAEEFQIERAQQDRQLIGMRVKAKMTAAFLDHFKIFPILRLERKVLHRG